MPLTTFPCILFILSSIFSLGSPGPLRDFGNSQVYSGFPKTNADLFWPIRFPLTSYGHSTDFSTCCRAGAKTATNRRLWPRKRYIFEKLMNSTWKGMSILVGAVTFMIPLAGVDIYFSCSYLVILPGRESETPKNLQAPYPIPISRSPRDRYRYGTFGDRLFTSRFDKIKRSEFEQKGKWSSLEREMLKFGLVLKVIEWIGSQL